MLHSRALILSILACIAVAAHGEPVRTILPQDVRDAYIDPAGRAILQSSEGDWRAMAEDVYAGKKNTIGGAKILLVDHLRRIWLRPDTDKDQLTIHMFDGKTWLTRNVADISDNDNRRLEAENHNAADSSANDASNGRIHFVGAGVEDAAGNIWFADGDRTQGWWIHQYSPDGKWSSIVLHERTLTGANARKKGGPRVLDFSPPQLQVGPDGLFCVAWSSTRVDSGGGQGASGFQQFDGKKWSEYFYPTGSDVADTVRAVIPLPDGSVGFMRWTESSAPPQSADVPPSGEPRVVWMSSAQSRPVPDLSKYLDRLSSVSAKDRERAQAELIAMGPRIRKTLEGLAADTDDPELKSRIPTILQEIVKPPAHGVYGGKLKFAVWRFLHQAKSGRVYLAVKSCKDLFTSAEFSEALVTVSPEGVWAAGASPTKKFGQSIDALDLYEDAAGRKWYRIGHVGVVLDDGSAEPRKVSDDADATIRGADAGGKLYLLSKAGLIVLDPAGKP